jgi:hypothetical protein
MSQNNDRPSESLLKPDFTPESINIVWEMGLAKIRDQIGMFDALDSKTGVIVGFVVVSIVEILGFLLLAAADADPTKSVGRPMLSSTIVTFFFFGLSFSFLSTCSGLFALRVHKFALGFDYEKMVRSANLQEGELKTAFLEDILESVRANKETLDKKTIYAKIASFLVLAGLLCYTVVVAKLFMGFVPGS